MTLCSHCDEELAESQLSSKTSSLLASYMKTTRLDRQRCLGIYCVTSKRPWKIFRAVQRKDCHMALKRARTFSLVFEFGLPLLDIFKPMLTGIITKVLQGILHNWDHLSHIDVHVLPFKVHTWMKHSCHVLPAFFFILLSLIWKRHTVELIKPCLTR